MLIRLTAVGVLWTLRPRPRAPLTTLRNVLLGVAAVVIACLLIAVGGSVTVRHLSRSVPALASPVSNGVFRYGKEFELVVEQNRRAIRLVRTLDLQFPILAHSFYAAEGVVEVTLRGEFQSFWPPEISPKLLGDVDHLNKLP